MCTAVSDTSLTLITVGALPTEGDPCEGEASVWSEVESGGWLADSASLDTVFNTLGAVAAD